jgi:6-phosphogluconolactonase
MKAILLVSAFFISLTCFSQSFYLLVGTYTNKGSKGIYVYRFNASTGTAEWVSNTDSVVNPSYLTIAPNGNYIYSVTESGGSWPGSISAFSFDRENGRLTFINKQPSGGDNPCYITTDKNGKWVAVGNYTGGNLSAFAVNKNGSLQPYAQLIQHTGSSINKERQEKPHVHCTIFSPDGKYIFTPDLGLDKVMIYRFNGRATKPMQPAEQAFVKSPPGNGPRHLTFHPNKRFAYLIEEMSGTVAAYAYHSGKLTFLQRLSTHPADYKGAIGSADIHLSPDGKFLYASNRGDANSIAIFSVQSNGKLVWKGSQSTMGQTPRNFIIDPTGNFLLVVNQNTNNIAIFRRNPKTGLLRYTDKSIEVPTPVCLQMMNK